MPHDTVGQMAAESDTYPLLKGRGSKKTAITRQEPGVSGGGCLGRRRQILCSMQNT